VGNRVVFAEGSTPDIIPPPALEFIFIFPSPGGYHDERMVHSCRFLFHPRLLGAAFTGLSRQRAEIEFVVRRASLADTLVGAHTAQLL